MKVISKVVLIVSLCVVVSCVQTIKKPVIKYEGPQPQTPEAILETFTDVSTKWPQDIKKKYPPNKWFQMLINKGVVIEDSYDFRQYMLLRGRLIHEERRYLSDPEKWLPKIFKIYPTMYLGTIYSDWETFEDAYIDRNIWEHQQRKAAKQKDPKVHSVKFMGPDSRTVLPLPKKSIIISRSPGGYGYSTGNLNLSEQQIFNIVYRGKHPWGWKVVYVDNMNNILPKRSAPISREELGLPADVPWPPKNRAHLDRIIEEVKQRRYLEDNR